MVNAEDNNQDNSKDTNKNNSKFPEKNENIAKNKVSKQKNTKKISNSSNIPLEDLLKKDNYSQIKDPSCLENPETKSITCAITPYLNINLHSDMKHKSFLSMQYLPETNSEANNLHYLMNQTDIPFSNMTVLNNGFFSFETESKNSKSFNDSKFDLIGKVNELRKIIENSNANNKDIKNFEEVSNFIAYTNENLFNIKTEKVILSDELICTGDSSNFQAFNLNGTYNGRESPFTKIMIRETRDGKFFRYDLEKDRTIFKEGIHNGTYTFYYLENKINKNIEKKKNKYNITKSKKQNKTKRGKTQPRTRKKYVIEEPLNNLLAEAAGYYNRSDLFYNKKDFSHESHDLEKREHLIRAYKDCERSATILHYVMENSIFVSDYSFENITNIFELSSLIDCRLAEIVSDLYIENNDYKSALGYLYFIDGILNDNHDNFLECCGYEKDFDFLDKYDDNDYHRKNTADFLIRSNERYQEHVAHLYDVQRQAASNDKNYNKYEGNILDGVFYMEHKLNVAIKKEDYLTCSIIKRNAEVIIHDKDFLGFKHDFMFLNFDNKNKKNL